MLRVIAQADSHVITVLVLHLNHYGKLFAVQRDRGVRTGIYAVTLRGVLRLYCVLRGSC
jgi:hypothetical protein